MSLYLKGKHQIFLDIAFVVKHFSQAMSNVWHYFTKIFQRRAWHQSHIFVGGWITNVSMKGSVFCYDSFVAWRHYRRRQKFPLNQEDIDWKITIPYLEYYIEITQWFVQHLIDTCSKWMVDEDLKWCYCIQLVPLTRQPSCILLRGWMVFYS